MQQQHELVTPGQRLGMVEDDREIGQGTYVRNGVIYSSVVGYVQRDGPSISVLRQKTPMVVPEVGDIVIVKITKVNPRAASAKIVCVNESVVPNGYGAMIRQQDVRLTEVDSVLIYECFRPGDVVRARVLSLGDRRYYFLSTQGNELGVIGAKSDLSGLQMVPVSWNEYMCPATKMREKRKVAKIQEQQSQ